MLIHRGYRYRCHPTPEQVAVLDDWQGKQRLLWNIAHTQRDMASQRPRCDRKMPSAFDQINELTDLRAEYPWLRDVPRDVQNQLLGELDLAWQRFLKGVSGYPKFKRKGRDRAQVIAPKGFRVDGDGRKRTLVFPKLGELAIVYHREHVGVMKRCSISRDGAEWYASIVCVADVPDPAPSTKPAVAIDRGVTNLLADSNGRIAPNPKHAVRLQPRIATKQRAAARKQKGSKNHAKASAQVRRLHQKVRRQRHHALHVESARYAKNHGVIVLEDLNVRAMSKSARGTPERPGAAQKRGLNRGILQAGWAMFAGMLRYKVVPNGGRVLDVLAAYSSQECSACRHVDAASRKGERFCCTACGHTEHADSNASKVILARGMRVLAVESTVTVCGDAGARGRSVKQKLRVARRGTQRCTASPRQDYAYPVDAATPAQPQ